MRYSCGVELKDFFVGEMPVVENDPFPHISANSLFSESVLDAVLDCFPTNSDKHWRRYSESHEAGKMEMSDPNGWPSLIAEVLEVMTSDEMAKIVGDSFGIPDLMGSTYGGGLHCSPRGARLAMHTDFTHHPDTGLYRRINMLLFLNKGWEESHGGALYLGDDMEVVVPPVFNQLGCFATSAVSSHGHPVPWNSDSPRRSLAVYFYSPNPPAEYSGPNTTVWKGE